MGLLLVQWCVRSQMARWPSHLLIKFNYFCPIPWLEIFCPWELRPVELRMLGQEEKSCKWVIRWNGSKRSHYHFHPLTPGPMNSGYIIVQFRTYTDLKQNTIILRYLKAGGVTESLVSHSSFKYISYFWIMEYVVRLVNSISMSPLLYFLYCEMNSFTRCNATGNAMMVVKAFWVSTGSRTGRKHYR